MKRFLSILAAVSVLPAVAAIAAFVLGLLGIWTSFSALIAGINVMPRDPIDGGRAIVVAWTAGDPITGLPPGGQPYMWDHAGVGYIRSYAEVGLQQYRPATMIVIKTWLAVLLFVPPPASYYAIRFYRWRRARALQMVGKCQRCGYDLRASKERCPECGTAIPAQPPRA